MSSQKVMAAGTEIETQERESPSLEYLMMQSALISYIKENGPIQAVRVVLLSYLCYKKARHNFYIPSRYEIRLTKRTGKPTYASLGIYGRPSYNYREINANVDRLAKKENRIRLEVRVGPLSEYALRTLIRLKPEIIKEIKS